jgi:hypothetical protein
MSPTRITLILVFAAAAAFGAWPTPIHLGESINTSAADQDPQLGPTGNVLYFSSSRPGGYGGYDIWAAYYINNSWQPAFNLGSSINTSYNEMDPAYLVGTNETGELFFTSDRPNVNGGYDIYRSVFAGGAWQTIANMAAINTVGNETDAFYVTSEQRLYYCSDAAGGYGGADIYYSDRSYEGVLSTPVNVGSGINTGSNERGPSVAGNGATLYFCSDRPGSLGNNDIYAATPVGGTWGNAANLGAPINTAYDDASPGISPNGLQLHFESTRPGGFGGLDIWGSNYTSGVIPASLGRVKASFR